LTRAPVVAVVIPARNEARRLPEVLDRLQSLSPAGLELRPIVVDDASTDATAEVARRRGCEVVRLSRNAGYGGALRAGSDHAFAGGADVIVHMDADGQHRPEDIPALVAPILAADDFVCGVRPISGEMPLLYRIGNRTLTLCMLGLFGVRSADSQCGLRAFRAAAYKRARWAANDYAVTSEIHVRARRAGLKTSTIPIPTIYLDRYKGTRPGDGLRILGRLLRWRLRMPRVPPAPGG